MRFYLIPVMGLCFGVEGLLLMAARHLGRGEISVGNASLAASLGALYGGACILVPEAGSLGYRLIVLALIGTVTFGLRQMRCIAVYGILSLAVVGLTLGVREGDRNALLLSAAMLLCLVLLGKPGNRQLVPLTLRYKKRTLSVDALYDTGNLLRDPITGQPVLVAGEYVASVLLGLERHQLTDPVETVKNNPIPGLRLLPYKTVGGSGFMLALTLRGGRTGKPERNILVAFAPSGLEQDGAYHALTGGAL